MNLIKTYLQNFLNRSGGHVFLATVVSRLLSFIASWVALQLIPNKELGIILFAFTIIAFLIPISGLGLEQGLLRYGSLLTTNKEKDELFAFIFKRGILAAFILIFSVILIGYFIPFQFNNTYHYLIILSFILLPHFIFTIIKTYYRLQYQNKKFALLDLTHAVFSVILITVLSYFFREDGYVLALLLTPLLTILWFIKQTPFNLNIKEIPKCIDQKFWSYGFFASLSNVATQLLFAIDILLIGYLMDDPEKVTDFKYISLIPFSVLFIPRVFIATDYVAFTERIKEVSFIKNYIKSYQYFFLIFGILLIGFSFLGGEFILSLFDASFVKYQESFLILTVGICGILILRGIYGNLLSSIGKAQINFYLISVALLLNIISNYFLIPKYGILGASITSAVLMWLTGIASRFLFWYYYSKTK